MPRRALKRLNKAARIAALLLAAALADNAAEAEIVPGQVVTGEDQIAPPTLKDVAAGWDASALQLEVTLNSIPANKIIAFTDLGSGRLAATRRNLEEIGVRAPGGGPPDELVPLDQIENLAFLYDEPGQRIDISTIDENRLTKVYDASDRNRSEDTARADYAAVLNYSLYAAGTAENDLEIPEFSGANLSLDGRLITPFGVLTQTGVAGQTMGSELDLSEAGYLRLDTTFTYADEEDMIIYRTGDLVSSAPDWSRPVRLAGLQAQRSFQLRPGIIAQSLPSYSGSAAVPSTVDVYVDNAKAYTREIGAGPFQIDNIPVITGGGTARIVVRDASGRETEQSLAFYTSPRLLRPGLWDFSVETGYARYDYGIESNEYGASLVGSGSFRAGLFDGLTVEGHVEGGDGLINGGAGAVVRASDLAVIGLAASASLDGDQSGYQLYGTFETEIGPVRVHARAQHTFEDYKDLAEATIREGLRIPGLLTKGGRFSIAPPKAVDNIGLSVPIELDNSSLGVNLIHYEEFDGETSNFVTATYTRPLIENATLTATGFADVENEKSAALYVGVNMPLGDNVSINGGVSHRTDRTGYSIDASRSLSHEPGSYGWHVRDHEGDNTYRSADVSYRAASAKVAAGVRQDEHSTRGTIEVEGAVAAIGGDIYTSNRIDDAFAVVDAGSAGVRVLRENNFIGETGDDGTILIPNLNSYQRNKLSIDPMALPINASIAETDSHVTPAFKSGIYVDFKVKRQAQGAIVVLTDASGAFLPAGSVAHLEGSDEPFMVGYDGQTYLTNLKGENIVAVEHGNTTCRAAFTFQPNPDDQQILGPEVCQ
jgi:outer membrane usher protein